jgi:outer membrane lipoprotein-sorting protein
VHQSFKQFAVLILSILLLLAHTATAQQQITPETILSRMGQALGGMEKLRAVENLYMRGKVEVAGLSGTVDDWQTARRQHRQIVDLGEVYKQTTIFDGTRGWVVDKNNQISDLAGITLEKEILSNYVGTFSYLFTDRMPGTITAGGEDPSGKYYLLRFKPKGGAEATYAVDKSTFLPFSMAVASKNGTTTTYFEDWREVDGIKLSFRYRQIEPDPSNNALVQQESVQLNTTIAATSFMRPQPSTPDFRFTNRQNFARIPIDVDDNAIFVRGWINRSAPLWFILDTGASTTVIDARRARALGLKSAGKIGGSGSGGRIEVKFTKGVNFTLPGVSLMNQTVASLPFRKEVTGIRPNFGGILGYDFISRFVMEIDYANKTLTLHDPKSYQYKGAGKRLPITIDGTPFIQAEVKVSGHDPVPGRFEIDTGYDGALTLYGPFVKAHPILAPTATSDPGVRQGLGQSLKSVKSQVESVAFGGFSFANVVTDFPVAEGGSEGDHDVSGLIGNEILRRFKVIFDYSRQEMILEPNVHLTDPFKTNTGGL